MKISSPLNFALVFLLLLSLPGFALALPGGTKPPRRARPAAKRPATQAEAGYERLLEQLRQTQQTAELARAEALQARRQNEALQRRLDDNNRELALLRQAIAAISLPANAPVAAPVAFAQTMAQDTPAALSDKLERLQEQVEVHTAQIAEHAQTKVESDARFRVKLSGILLANTFFNSHDTSLNDVPLIAPAPGAITRKNNFGASLRQSRIGLTMEGPRLGNALGNARLGAEAEFDFWAGDFPDVNGLFRILTASTRLDWERTSLIVGQRQPMISPLNPTSLAAYWFPALTAAGNLGQWRPQIMLEHRAPLNESSQFIAQAGLLMPFGETLQETTIEGGLGYQSRLAYRHEATQDRPLEIGLGGYLHRRALPLARNINSWALTGDWQAPLGSRVRLTGEAYYGQAISLGEPTVRADRVYAANGLITRQAVTVRGVRSAGGWAQLALRAHARLEFNLAYGQNDPRNADINAGARNTGTRYKNQAASANFIWQAQQNFLISLEFRRLLTHYPTARQTGNHLNLAFGYVF